MSNRLETLSAQCRKYHFKKFLKRFVLFLVLLSLPISTYYIYLLSQPADTTQKSLVLTPNPILPVTKVTHKTVQKPASAQDQKVQTAPVEKKVLSTSITEKKSLPEPSVEKVNYFSDLSEEQSIEDWIEKYNQKKSYYSAIYISKHYFREKEYKQAGIWAKRANQLDRDKEEAWLYYAKSVHALNNVEKARRILTIYLQYKESAKAEILLSEWGKNND